MFEFLATFSLCLFGLWVNYHCSEYNVVYGRMQLRYMYIFCAFKVEQSHEKLMLRFVEAEIQDMRMENV